MNKAYIVRETVRACREWEVERFRAFPHSSFETNKLPTLIIKGYDKERVLRIARTFLSSDEWFGAAQKIDIESLEVE
jgi:hypothetical protein